MGFLSTWFVLATLKALRLFSEKDYISYNDEPRAAAELKSFKKISYKSQLIRSIKNVLIPHGMINAVLAAIVMSYLMPDPSSMFPESWQNATLSYLVLDLLIDFFMYFGHRLVHENEWLWTNVHSVHHQVETPTPVATGWTDNLNTIITLTLPTLAGAIITRPHPMVFSCYTFCSISHIVLNHSGLDNRIVNAITLRILPFRVSIRHHDEHHKYSNYGKNAKNCGEFWTIWDIMFSTHRKSISSMD